MFDEKSILCEVKDEVLRTIIYKILKNSNWSVEEIAKVLEVDEEIVKAAEKQEG
jgi:predicted transcriptional regulator